MTINKGIIIIEKKKIIVIIIIIIIMIIIIIIFLKKVSLVEKCQSRHICSLKQKEINH